MKTCSTKFIHTFHMMDRALLISYKSVVVWIIPLNTEIWIKWKGCLPSIFYLMD